MTAIKTCSLTLAVETRGTSATMPNLLLLVVICGVIIYTSAVDSVPLSCLPRTDDDPCPPDHEIAPCTTRGTKDKCVPCAPGLRMCDATTSAFPSKCYDPRDTCSADGDNVVQVIDDPDGGCTISCLCNESAGFTGANPLQCQSYDQACDQSSSHELVGVSSSRCLPCPENYHNPKDDGLDKCVLRSTSSSTAAPLLVLPTSTATPPQPVSAATMTPSAVLETNNKLDNGNDMQSIHFQTGSNSNTNIISKWYIWFSVAILACGIIVGVVAVLCYRTRTKDSVDRTNAQNRMCICCVFGSVSSCPGTAVINEGLPAENHQLLVRYGTTEQQHLQESDAETDEPIESLPRQSTDQPEQPIAQPEQPEQPIAQPEQPEPPIAQPGQPKHCGSLPSYDPPPYSTGELLDPTSHDGPCAMTARTICATTPQHSSLQGQQNTSVKSVVKEGHIAEVSKTEKKRPVSDKHPVVERMRTEKPVLPQHQAEPEPEPKPQPQPQPGVVESRNQSLGSEPPSLGGESLHLSSFKSGPTPTL
ncbi:uncharacterized protein LOC124144921 isoform X2 [Haliotis rufescens]|uniref:uncharacterized protein LOC124144921 isoform X2 n=1 Tax=Haliotis rufescens TaxID=6454 RepID=UPI00201F39AA|nr:uncharacterized protein LOC124144921 isoform X2 [Haliotis rufescens]